MYSLWKRFGLNAATPDHLYHVLPEILQFQIFQRKHFLAKRAKLLGSQFFPKGVNMKTNFNWYYFLWEAKYLPEVLKTTFMNSPLF